MRRQTILLLSYIFIYAILSSSCSHSRYIKPLEKGETNASFDFGGPIISFQGLKIPIPLSSVAVGYGLTDKTTVFGGLQTTALLYRSLQIELGLRQQLLSCNDNKWIPAFSGGVGMHGITSLRNGTTRIYPNLELSPYWESGAWLWYLNGSLWFDFYSQPKYDFDNLYLPSIALGQSYQFNSWQLGLEYKYLGFNHNSENSVVAYQTLTGYGAHGLYLTCSKSF